MDALDSSIGAVLSQRSPSDQKLDTCAFYSYRLTPVEKNYEVDNWKPLVLVMALRAHLNRLWYGLITKLCLTFVLPVGPTPARFGGLSSWVISTLPFHRCPCPDSKEFVAACSVCASKSSHHAPAGLLRPRPIPHRPWLHITVDFVTGLSPSEGNTILTIVDRFSKLVHPFEPLLTSKYFQWN